MTENEALKTLEDLQRLLTHYRHISTELTEANGIAIQALEEIQAYRAIGLTPELIQAMQGHNIAMINELEEFQKIGTVEELQALKEKAEPKKVILRKDGTYDCVCGNAVIKTECYCSDCGQKLDWS